MARLSLTFLGSVQVALGQQPITHFRSANNQALLAYLALHAGNPQPREALAALLWPEETADRSRNNLRQALYQLRSLLGDLQQPQQPFLLTTRQAVTFNRESDYALDVQDFLAALDERDLQTAVSIYQGDLLPGLASDSAEFEEWLRQESQTLHRLAMAAMNELAHDQLQDGLLGEAQATARRQLALEPWREPAFRQLMRAYALAGDRTNALAQYETCRAALLDELGIEPDARTTALYEDIKAGRVAPATGDQTIQAPPKRRHNLPAETTPLIGREHELSRLNTLLNDEGQRLVTIAGPGGMGKTRLAQSVGLSLLPAFRDGVYFVDLAPLEHPGEIPTAITAAIRYQVPDKTQPVLPQLLQTLSRRRMLLILDNFEHLPDGTAVVSELLQACPDLALLVTSRQKLNLAVENRFELGGLDYPDGDSAKEALSYTAVQLFVASGRRTRVDFTLNGDNEADVIRITQSVQGMPLGLLLAASWLELLSTAEVARELESGIEFLSADLADLPPRQRSMQTVLERSWVMMTPDEQRVLARLSIFRGGFTREAAEEVAGANLRILFSLVNKSLIQRQPGNGRFTMHELLRQFAAARREPDDQIEELHCTYFAEIVAKEIRRGLSYYPGHLPTHLPAERDNFRRAWEYALEYALADVLITLTRGLISFSFFQGVHPTKMLAQAIHRMQNRVGAIVNPSLLELRFMSSHFLYDNPAEKRFLLKLAAEVAEHNDAALLYWVYQRLIKVENDFQRSEALNWADKAYQTALESGDDLLVQRAAAELLWMQVAYGVQGDSAYEVLQEMLAGFEKHFAESNAVYQTLLTLSAHCLSTGEYDLGIHYANRSLNIAKGWQDLLWISNGDFAKYKIYLKMGREDDAGRCQLDALDWHQAIGQDWQTLGTLWSLCVYHPELLDSPETAVSTIAMVYHHSETLPLYKQYIERGLLDFPGDMSEEVFSRAWERGKEIDFETAVAEFRAALAGT